MVQATAHRDSVPRALEQTWTSDEPLLPTDLPLAPVTICNGVQLAADGTHLMVLSAPVSA